MRESRTYGSERGARGNSRPYRDTLFAALHESGCGTNAKSRDVRFVAAFGSLADKTLP